MKICTKCHISKNLEDFYKNPGNTTGLDPVCKSCKKEYRELKGYNKYNPKYNKTNSIYHREYYLSNKEKIHMNNRNRLNKDVSKKLSVILRVQINNYIRRGKGKKHTSILNLLGVDIQEFKNHINLLFRPEMNWENYGDIWELDHILPCSSFDLTQECQIKECFNYKNYQPLFKTTKIAEDLGYKNEIGNRNKHKKIMDKNSRTQYQRMQELAGIIKENEQPTDDHSNISAVRATYSTVLTPKGVSAEEVSNALGDIENYGELKTQALRNSAINKAEINKAIDAHFGPSIPSRKKAAEKQRGEPFPIRTKQALDDFMKQFTSKPKLVNWEVKDNTVVFKQGKNPSKNQLKQIIDTVMKNAGIEYELSEKEEI